MSRYLLFDLVPASTQGVTKVWNVHPRADTRERLGHIAWHTPWRRYVFHVHDAALFDADCLMEVQTFLREKTVEQQEDARARREARAAA